MTPPRRSRLSTPGRTLGYKRDFFFLKKKKKKKGGGKGMIELIGAIVVETCGRTEAVLSMARPMRLAGGWAVNTAEPDITSERITRP